jgi:hypothetical protein
MHLDVAAAVVDGVAWLLLMEWHGYLLGDQRHDRHANNHHPQLPLRMQLGPASCRLAPRARHLEA